MTLRLRVLVPAVLLAALLLAAPAGAAGEFIFYGYAQYVPAKDVVGATMDVYGIAAPGSIAPPIALDFANYQYTVWVDDMVIATYSNLPTYLKSSSFNGGVLRIYEDAKATGTAADYANLATFTDGTLILQASVDDGWSYMLIDGPTIRDGIFVGSGSGRCDFNGGSRLGELVAGEYYLDDWSFLGTPVSDPNPTVPAGFHRVFDVKIVAPNDPTPTEPQSWGQVKGSYR